MGVLMEPAKVNLGRDGGAGSISTSEPRYPAMTGAAYYADIQGFAMQTMETEFGKIVQPIPLMVYKPAPAPLQHLLAASTLHGTIGPFRNGFTESARPIAVSEEIVGKEASSKTVRPPPKKKWIKEYLEEEPRSPAVHATVAPRNGVVVPRASTPVAVPVYSAAPAATSAAPSAAADFSFEHSRPRTNSHGPSIPSPSSSCSGTSTREAAGGGARAGTREVHNKLEKNRRAHLKECFELLKRQLPAAGDDKKASNLSILGSANRYIQVLRRKERECEHEMERLAREKIAAQQRLAALKREVAARHGPAPRLTASDSSPCEEREREERINGQLLGIPISITSASAGGGGGGGGVTVTSHSLISALPIQLATSSSSTAQGVVRASYGARQLTLTTLAHADPAHPPPHPPPAQNGQPGENGFGPALGTALVHPTHLHLPLSQVVRGGLVVGGAALQLVSGAAGALRVLHTAPAASPHLTPHSGASGREAARLPAENGVVCSAPSEGAVGGGGGGAGAGGGVVMNGLVVSQGQAQLLHTHSFTHKTLETQVVSAQYLSAGALVKPMVVVTTSAAPGPAPPHT